MYIIYRERERDMERERERGSGPRHRAEGGEEAGGRRPAPGGSKRDKYITNNLAI